MKVVRGNVEFISCEIHAEDLLLQGNSGNSCLLKLANFDFGNF